MQGRMNVRELYCRALEQGPLSPVRHTMEMRNVFPLPSLSLPFTEKVAPSRVPSLLFLSPCTHEHGAPIKRMSQCDSRGGL